MKFGVLGLIVALTLASSAVSKPAPSPPSPAAGPEAFVRWVYGRYVANRVFDSQAAYSPALKALFARNTKLLHGEVGDNNDSDMICQCQDWYTIHITRLTMTSVVADRAEADIAFTNGEAHEALKLELLRTPLGWRVDDVIHPDPGRNPSLRASLLDENRRLAKGR